MLRLVNFQKSYNNFPALSIDDLTIEQGIYWIKGANGSGKSTLLKTIAGILDFRGDILLNGNVSVKKQTMLFAGW